MNGIQSRYGAFNRRRPSRSQKVRPSSGNNELLLLCCSNHLHSGLQFGSSRFFSHTPTTYKPLSLATHTAFPIATEIYNQVSHACKHQSVFVGHRHTTVHFCFLVLREASERLNCYNSIHPHHTPPCPLQHRHKPSRPRANLRLHPRLLSLLPSHRIQPM